MTEHVHEWAINIAFEHNYGAWGVCKNCMEVLKQEEIEARLNEYETLKAATERLSAEDADGLASCARICSGGDDGLGYNAEEVRLAQCADAYANILEGKDD